MPVLPIRIWGDMSAMEGVNMGRRRLTWHRVGVSRIFWELSIRVGEVNCGGSSRCKALQV